MIEADKVADAPIKRLRATQRAFGVFGGIVALIGAITMALTQNWLGAAWAAIAAFNVIAAIREAKRGDGYYDELMVELRAARQLCPRCLAARVRAREDTERKE